MEYVYLLGGAALVILYLYARMRGMERDQAQGVAEAREEKLGQVEAEFGKDQEDERAADVAEAEEVRRDGRLERAIEFLRGSFRVRKGP